MNSIPIQSEGQQILCVQVLYLNYHQRDQPGMTCNTIKKIIFISKDASNKRTTSNGGSNAASGGLHFTAVIRSGSARDSQERSRQRQTQRFLPTTVAKQFCHDYNTKSISVKLPLKKWYM